MSHNTPTVTAEVLAALTPDDDTTSMNVTQQLDVSSSASSPPTAQPSSSSASGTQKRARPASAAGQIDGPASNVHVAPRKSARQLEDDSHFPRQHSTSSSSRRRGAASSASGNNEALHGSEAADQAQNDPPRQPGIRHHANFDTAPTPSLMRATQPSPSVPIEWHNEYKWTPEFLLGHLRRMPRPELEQFAARRKCQECLALPIPADQITLAFIKLRGGLSLPDLSTAVPGLGSITPSAARDAASRLIQNVWVPAPGAQKPQGTGRGLLFQRVKDMDDSIAVPFARSLGLPTTHAQWFLGHCLVDLGRTLQLQIRKEVAAAPLSDALSKVHSAAGGDWDVSAFLSANPPPPEPHSTDAASLELPLPPAVAVPDAPAASRGRRAQVHLVVNPHARLIGSAETEDPSPLVRIAGIMATTPAPVQLSAMLIIQQLFTPNKEPVDEKSREYARSARRPDDGDAARWNGWLLHCVGLLGRGSSGEAVAALDAAWLDAFLRQTSTTSTPTVLLSSLLAPGNLHAWSGKAVRSLWSGTGEELATAMAPLLSATGWDLSVRGVTLAGARRVGDVGINSAADFWAALADTLLAIGTLISTRPIAERPPLAGFAFLLLVTAVRCQHQAVDYRTDRISLAGAQTDSQAGVRFELRLMRGWLLQLATGGTLRCAHSHDDLRDAWEASRTPAAGTAGPVAPPGTQRTLGGAAAEAHCSWCLSHGRPPAHRLLSCWAIARSVVATARNGGDATAFVRQVLCDHAPTLAATAHGVDQATTALLQLGMSRESQFSPAASSGAGRTTATTARSSPQTKFVSRSASQSGPTGRGAVGESSNTPPTAAAAAAPAVSGATGTAASKS